LAALFGVRNRDGWGVGLTILTALANLVPSLPGEQVYLSLYQGIRRTANDCDGAAPRRDRHPLDGGERSMATLGRWLRHWTRVRHREGAERTVLTAIAAGASPGELCELMLIAVTDRYFADGGHALDFLNKAFECLEIIGWEHAAAVLPTVVDQMVSARGGEELNAWRHPTDLVPLCEAAFADLPAALAVGERRRGGWRDHAGLAHGMLGDDPATIIGAIRSAVRAGATATDLSRALAYAAALRVAWFGTSNEFSDWVTAHHCFTYCNALHQSLKRIEGTRPAGGQLCPEVLRGIFHGAMRVYLNRFLNVPPARLPRPDNGALDDLPSDPEALCKRFLSALNRQGEVPTAARIVASYAALDHPIEPLIVALVHAVLREDSAFHTYQMLEAGVRQYRDWGRTEEGRNILIAVARYLAAHSPTERAQLQTATVARRLSRGESVHDPEPADGPQ
jgi:hypothetical protein